MSHNYDYDWAAIFLWHKNWNQLIVVWVQESVSGIDRSWNSKELDNWELVLLQEPLQFSSLACLFPASLPL